MKSTMQKLKNDFFKTASCLCALVLVCCALSAFKTSPKVVNDQVTIYGIIYLEKCNSESALTHVTRLVPANNYYKEQEALEKQLRNTYPHAKRIQMGNSKFQYGSDASNMCVLKWTKGDKGCEYVVMNVSFGASQAEALENAIKDKNTWAGTNAEYSVVEQKYW